MNTTKEERFWQNKLHLDQGKTIVPFEIDREKDFLLSEYSELIPNYEYHLIENITSGNLLKTQIVLLATFSVVLYKYTGENIIRFGTPIDKETDLESYKGSGILPIEQIFQKGKTFRTLLNEIKETLVECVFYQNFEFTKLYKNIESSSSLSGNPLYDVVCSLTNVQIETAPLRKKNNFTIEFDIKNNSITSRVIYNENRYSESFIKEFLAVFYKVIGSGIQYLDNAIDEINVSLENNSNTINLLNEFQTERNWVSIFEESVKKYPGKKAIEHDGTKLSYKELDLKSNQLANYLVKTIGDKKETSVGLLLENSIETIISILGVLKAGFTFLPIDVWLPKERIKYILEEAKPSLIIVDDVFEGRDLSINGFLKFNISKRKKFNDEKGEKLNIKKELNTTAYIIYTSGTSGNPKGVKISHKSLINYCNWSTNCYAEKGEKNAVFPLFSSISFDLTITSIFVPLILGDSIVVYNAKHAEEIFEQMLDDDKIDILKLTPSHLKLLIESVKNKQIDVEETKLHTLIVGGETLSSNLVKECKIYFPKIKIFNEYGPTEATVGCIVAEYKESDSRYLNIPIGKPINNTSVYLLDENGKSIPKGAVGEIYIGGNCLAEGYLNNEELTKSKFVKLLKDEDLLFYKTGDLAKQLPDDCYYYVGRKDSQVKINGYRIELQEIGNRAKMHKKIEEAHAVVNKKFDSTPQIILFIKIINQIDNEELLGFLSQFLPEYMLPSYIQTIKNIPLTINGKIDGSKLLTLLTKKDNIESPANDIEKKLHDIWISHLGVERLDINANFYTSGGDSIKSLGLMNEVNKSFRVQMKIKELYELKTIKEMAERISILKGIGHVVEEQQINVKRVKSEVDKLKEEILSQI